ncbi:glycerophosphodiester phosphodiesterase family protein [Paludibacterium yongneupense]|uniref:glycerophosphodiester phosphodiesterase family protein n=1 Tax=Paludibacterium yongneupense TaxID=400061 RepID=UPI0004156B06|nr:glycerophosphodiester phosphodiesterase family protein [Paludibacterium yongneupense]
MINYCLLALLFLLSVARADPLLVAHRGGTGDAPENTLPAIRAAIANGAEMMWLTVQLSRDGVPVLYRPADLSALTPQSGPVAGRTADELATINAGWRFHDASAHAPADYPYREHAATIPTLREALRLLPATMTVVLDMKALPAVPQARAVARLLDEEGAWGRVLIYSTAADYQAAFAPYPAARVFEARDATRNRLLAMALRGECLPPPAPGSWVAFEYERDVAVVETFTLGQATSALKARLWTPQAVACLRRQGGAKLLAIAVNDAGAYRDSACLGLDAVLVDSPRTMRALRTQGTPACVPAH